MTTKNPEYLVLRQNQLAGFIQDHGWHDVLLSLQGMALAESQLAMGHLNDNTATFDSIASEMRNAAMLAERLR